ncbi:MAG: 50S ribosomal protein L3 [Deltaproteobacteria bacterium]|nr:50S ribosomal protein L3 [Deltaproteobacteria bacterium]
MANQKMGLIGRKLGMTQLFAEDGTVTAVTVIQAAPNHVLQVKTADGPDAYNAVQLGFEPRKESGASKPQLGHFKKANAEALRFVREIRLDEATVKDYAPGQTLGVQDVFSDGDRCDVIGTSKGSGFTGVMKRFGFRGFMRTHGTHEFFRHGGSIGTRLTPGHVFKGKKMPGQMGNWRVTIQNLTVMQLDNERGLVFVKGGVPGPVGGMVIVRKAVKKG